MTGLVSGRALRLLVLLTLVLVPDVDEEAVLLLRRAKVVPLLALVVMVLAAVAGGMVKYVESVGAEEVVVGAVVEVDAEPLDELRVPMVMLGVTDDVGDVAAALTAPRRFKFSNSGSPLQLTTASKNLMASQSVFS